MGSRGPLWNALAGERGPWAYAPYLWEFAAEQAALSPSEMAASPSAAVAALGDAVTVANADAMHVVVDDPAAPAVEAVRRLALTALGRDVVAVLPGPERRVSDAGDPFDAAEDTEDAARAALEAGCTVIALDEPRVGPASAAAIRTVAKLARFYDARCYVLGPATAVDVAVDAGADAVDTGAVPAGRGVAIAAARAGHIPAARVVTSSWSPPPRVADRAWLIETGAHIRQRNLETPCR